MVEDTIGSVVELNFCQRFAKDLANFSQGFGIIIINAWKTFMKYLAKFYFILFHFTIKDILPVLPGNEQDLGHENLVNTYLFYQVCKVHNIV